MVWASAKARPVMRWARRGAGLCFARACALRSALVGVGAHLQPLGLLWRRFAVLLMLLSRALGGLGLGRLGRQCEQLCGAKLGQIAIDPVASEPATCIWAHAMVVTLPMHVRCGVLW